MNNGWKQRGFDACIEPVTYTRKVQRKDFLARGAYPIISQEEDFINGYWDDDADLFNVTTPIVVFGDHTKIFKYVDFNFVLGADGVKILQPRDFLVPRFFFYQLQTANLDSLGYARHYKLLRELEISYPSRPEQQRIVGILDKAFEHIAAAETNTERNLQNARTLFDSHLQSVFAQSGRGWLNGKLKAVTTKIGSGATPRGGEEAYKREGISLIRSLNVHDLGFSYARLAFLDDSQAADLSNVQVQPHDVLLNITGASIARCCLVPEQVLPARVNQHVSIIRPIEEKLDSAFLHYMLISRSYKDRLLQTGEDGGSTRQALTKAQIEDFSVEYPERIEEQKTIAATLDAMLSKIEHLTGIYTRKLAALEALKKSLLHQAFTGKL